MNKLILFIVGEVDQAIERGEFLKLDTYTFIISKVFRRYEKETLYRLLLFIRQKATQVDNTHLDDFISYLTQVSKKKSEKGRTKAEKEASDKGSSSDSD